MTLTIVLPVYNVEKYLSKCIESIIDQTYGDFELIVINDGSTDCSLDIAKEYALKDSRIKIISQKNAGLSAARNSGIIAAKGDYISFVDSDDTIDLGMYERMMSEIFNNQADVVVCGHRVLSENQEIISEVKHGHHVLTGCQATKMVLDDSILPSFSWGKIYKRSLFNNISFPSGRIYEDIATTYKLFDAADTVIIIDEIYYNYYRRAGSICLSPGLEREYKRNTHLYLSFKERYVFVNNNAEYQEQIPVCALGAFNACKNLLHAMLRGQNNYNWEVSIGLLISDLTSFYEHCHYILPYKSRVEMWFITNTTVIYKWLSRLYFKLKYKN